MDFNDALAILSNRAEDQKRKLETALKYGGMLTATDKAMEIARECIKRCRDFEILRGTVGGKSYFAAFDENFPEESEGEEHFIYDASANGLVRLDEGAWCDPGNLYERLFWTREEAEAKLEELKHEVQQM